MRGCSRPPVKCILFLFDMTAHCKRWLKPLFFSGADTLCHLVPVYALPAPDLASHVTSASSLPLFAKNWKFRPIHFGNLLDVVVQLGLCKLLFVKAPLKKSNAMQCNHGRPQWFLQEGKSNSFLSYSFPPFYPPLLFSPFGSSSLSSVADT